MSDGGRRLGTDFREGFVVVVSILIAFALDAGWDARVERVEQREILESLLTEFRRADESIVRFQEFHARVDNGLAIALNALRDARAEGAAVAILPDTALMLAFIPPTYDPQMSALDALVSSGQVAFIESTELRAELSGWRGLFEEAAEDEYLGRDLVYEHLAPALARHVDITPYELTGNELLAGALTAAEAAATSEIPATTEIIGAFAVRLGVDEHTVRQLADVESSTKRIIQLLEQELGVEPDS